LIQSLAKFENDDNENKNNNNVTLMCFCQNEKSCHRSIVKDAVEGLTSSKVMISIEDLLYAAVFVMPKESIFIATAENTKRLFYKKSNRSH
jgi:hypothetical protein